MVTTKSKCKHEFRIVHDNYFYIGYAFYCIYCLEVKELKQ